MQSSATSNIIRPPSNNMDTLISAGKAVETVITRDETYPDLGDVLTGGTSDLYIKPLLSSTEEFSETNRIPIPSSILSEMDTDAVNCRCFMGLLPEIGRAWITIDHRLFIWNYNNPREIFEYKDQDQIIISVGIVKPKPDIFGDKISYLLVLSTPLQVILLGLSVLPNDLKVYGTDMIVPADDIQMKKITGTDDGRIFMIGNDANVYEFVYNHPEHWLTSKCYIECKTLPSYMKYIPQFVSKIGTSSNKALAVDNERKVLYLMNETTIEAIHIGDKTNEYRSIAKNNNIIESALQICRQYSRSYNADSFRLESVHVISKAESKRVHLMAITSAGFRLYFSLYREGFRNNITPTSNIPNALELGHIRIPPPNEASSNDQGVIRHTYYDCGICLIIKNVNDNYNTITATAAAPSITSPEQQQTSYPLISAVPNRPVYVETVDTVTTHLGSLVVAETRSEERGKRPMKEISQQLSQPPRQFITMTTRAVVFYNKMRPVDILFKILGKQGRLNIEEKKDYQTFFDRYGKTESCAMCLSIICNTDAQDIVAKATSVFFEYGGAPTSINSTQTIGNHLGQSNGTTGVTFSGKHDGFLLYFSRMIAPIWKLKVFADCDTFNSQSKVLYAKVQSILFDSRVNLERLKAFMDKNSKFHNSANISDPRFQAADRTKLELDLAEQKSVHELYLLLSQCIDVVFFIEFLLDSNLQTILTPDIPSDYLNILYNLDVSTILTTIDGRELARELVIATIGKYGASNSHTSFDVVSRELQRRCKLYFGESDILFFKGMEYLKRAMCAETEHERSLYIKESLNYFKNAANNIPTDKMRAICQVYIQYSFHLGVVQLALARAHMLDPQNLAITAFESPQSSTEIQNNLLKVRMEAYDFALEALNDAHRLKSQPLPAGRTPIGDPNVYSRMVTDTALESKDIMFHFRLYRWFMENNLKDELLMIDTPYLVTYFEKYVNDPNSSLDFLWKYYRNRHRYYQAAVYLHQLAFSNSPSLQLSQRIEYLALANINIQAVSTDNTISPSEAALFCRDLNRDIKNSYLQQRIQNILRSTEGIEAQVAADELNRVLLKEDELWEQYGSKYHVLSNVFSGQFN